MRYLKQNTAVRITVGPFVDHADGVTPLDSMTVTDIACILTNDDDDNSAVNHQHLTLSASAGDNDIVTAGGGGLWDQELTAANVNFTGRARLCYTDADQICPVFEDFQVLAANVYDSLFAGAGPTADLLDVNSAQVLGTAIHAPTENGTQCVEVVRWGGNDIAATAINGTPKVDIAGYRGTAAHTETTAGLIPSELHQILGTIVATPTTAGLLDVNVLNYAGAAAVHTTDGIPDVNIAQYLGTAAHAATVAGLPVVQLHNSAGTGGINAPANFEDLAIVDTTGLVAVPDTQKVDVETIKTRAVTCAAGVTVLAQVGAAGAPGANNGLPTTDGTKLNQTVDLTAGQSIAASSVPSVTLANGAHGGAAATLTLSGAAGLVATKIDAAINGALTGNLSGSVGSVTGAVGSVTGAVGSVTGAVGSVTGAVGSVTAGVSVANGGIASTAFAAGAVDAASLAADAGTEIATAVLARALAAESYAADAGTPTLSQMLWMIWAGLVDFSISGTTLTVNKQDGTAAMTFTLDDATSPTSRTRAT